ncbi:hypothetical protein [Calidifontibacillus oryziterrae]|uniref:hypothetical protein n=1 Tax=Calidifontibacillus oryziterrae TaxID=1191699 RepID=UPI0002F81569|nr:hypothetical protein [Calidifontibacillus oryziterrae]
MLVFFLVIGGAVLLFTVFEIVINRNWTLIYTAFGYESYSNIKAKLEKYGVKTKTTSPMGFGDRTNPFKNTTQYDIYVRKTDIHKATKALHER